MKFKNKHTGDIMEFDAVLVSKDGSNESVELKYNSIQKFVNDWEDYEEPKEYWFINEFGRAEERTSDGYEEDFWNKVVEKRKLIGDYFETREEAEKAVEWLKAFNMLKQDTKGYKFDNDNYNYNVVYNTRLGKLDIFYDMSFVSSLLYFATKEDAEESIKKHRKEWLIYLGVEEEK